MSESPIHSAAAHGFGAAADAYARGRPEYPADLDAWLVREAGIGAGATVVDLGAGTGKFTRRIHALGARCIAVEPVAAMLAELRRAAPAVAAVAGSADAIPLADGSVDAIVCAQSFHWFATVAAVAEIRRVLRPGGALALVWNVRDETTDWVAALTAILAPYEGDAPRYHRGDWRKVFPAPGFDALAEARFPNDQHGPPDSVIVDRALSTSFIAALPPAERATVERRVRDLIASTPALAGRDVVTFPYTTSVFVTRKL